MKRLLLLITFGLCSLAVSAQTAKPTPVASGPEVAKLDSLAKLAQRFMNANQPDSLYGLMGASFKQQISPEKMKDVTGQIAGRLGNWVSMEPKGMKDGVARYKATFALSPIDFYISQDKQGKIETFLFKPWQE
ncbi:DUF3887 domain-containing protein [Spirosoma agri]|uniref:DUF3887 domain-containing protein n=1 Tax=Spirosoma agri TaxID=1987381 RepID=A0A6M0IKB6_9BACT|nr:hypothetical protein [Spirosoma agri]NEU68728.1 hypothetical protein [Spirosoma agri]